jgi:serine protease
VIVPAKTNTFSVEFEIVCNIFLPEPPIALTDGVPSDLLGLTLFETQSFTLAIEPGARVTCSTTADSGDADLFIRFDAKPDFLGGGYICRSITDLSEETCIARDPGGAFVLWALVAAFTSIENLAITCSATLPPPPTILTDGVASNPFSLSSSQTQTFTLAIASGDTVMCETAAGNGDADLLVRWDAEPSSELVLSDCISVGASSAESCTVVDPGDASVLWVLVYAFSDVSRFGILSVFCLIC